MIRDGDYTYTVYNLQTSHTNTSIHRQFPRPVHHGFTSIALPQGQRLAIQLPNIMQSTLRHINPIIMITSTSQRYYISTVYVKTMLRR